MSNSYPSSPATPRSTLTLKAGARKPAREIKTSPPARTQNPSKFKPGARWSDG